MALNDDFRIVLDEHGLFSRAETEVAGVVHQIIQKKGMANWKAFSETKFLEKGEQYLTLHCSMSVPQEIAILDIRDNSKESKIILDFSKYDGAHKIFVSGNVRKREISGVLDPSVNSYTGDTIALDTILEQSTLRRLSTFLPIFQDAKLKFDEIRKPYEDIINRTIHNSAWGSAGRAACWGFAGLAVAACCAGGFGVGCAAGAFAFGVAASVCSDQY
jgi:hypothetical protein